MSILAIMAVIAKGISIAQTAIAVGKNAGPAIEAVKGLVDSFREGTVTPEKLEETEASLDAMIDEFNEPMAD